MSDTENQQGQDTGNTDPELLTAPLAPDDDVFTLIQEQRKTARYTNVEEPIRADDDSLRP